MNKLKGIDISSWQGNVNFSKVKSSGIQFIIPRSSYRQNVDKQFHAYVQGAKAVGISILGVYHFSYALNVEQAKQEAAFCIKEVEKAGLGKDTIIFFDFEYDTVTQAAKSGVKLGRTQCNQHTKAFCEYVESKGYRAGIYANIDYYKNMYDHDLLSKYVFWLADWTGDADYPCTVHQYSSKGSVNGISGLVDMNYYFGEREVSKPTKTIDEVAQEVLAGLWGNGDARKNALIAAGYDYSAVQKRVNELLAPSPEPRKTAPEIAYEFLSGKIEDFEQCKKELEKYGYEETEAFNLINQILILLMISIF